MKHACFIAAAVAVALLGFAGPANATHGDGLQCGDSIETAGTVVLQSDLACPGDAAIVISASNVSLSLGGHTITGRWGILSTGDLSNVHIRGGAGGTGTIAVSGPGDPQFSGAVQLVRASNSSVAGLKISGPNGIVLDGNNNEVFRNEAAGGSNIQVYGENAHIHRNIVRGNAPGAMIIVAPGTGTTANNARVAVNEIECVLSGTAQTGISVGGYTDSAIVARNTVTGCWAGITLDAARGDPAPPGGAEIRRNVSNANQTSGIGVYDPAARLWCNETNGNLRAGIVDNGSTADGATFLVENNRANNNSSYGINAPDAIDGGGNTATGNFPDDCTPNIVCTTPPDPPCAAAGA